jgi:hypothetical protein
LILIYKGIEFYCLDEDVIVTYFHPILFVCTVWHRADPSKTHCCLLARGPEKVEKYMCITFERRLSDKMAIDRCFVHHTSNMDL